MSKQLDMLVLYALDVVASRGIWKYKHFIKTQGKLNSVTMAGLESNNNK